MSIGLIGKKIGMTQYFVADENKVVPATVVDVASCCVTQIKTKEKDGYTALQVGFKEVLEKSLSKPERGHFAKAGVGFRQSLREFRVDNVNDYKVGQQLNADMFKVNDYVDVSSVSIGRGFQGGMKRWNWSGGPSGHGSMSHRAPGSIGANTYPGRVIRGHHLPGRMGGVKTTVQNLEVLKVDIENKLLVLKGPVAGYNGAIVSVFKAKKKDKRVIRVATEATKKGSGAKKNIKKKK